MSTDSKVGMATEGLYNRCNTLLVVHRQKWRNWLFHFVKARR